MAKSLTDKFMYAFCKMEERPMFCLIVLLGFSLLIKAVMIYQADILNRDAIRYINSAHELFQGNIAASFAYEKMMGFTFLLGLTHLLITDWFLAAKVLSGIALVLTTIPLYLISQELFGRRSAFCTALVFSVVPSISGRCTSVIKDPSFLFLTVLSLWLVLYAYKESNWFFTLIAGFFCCLSVLIRPEGVVFFASVGSFLLFSLAFMADSRKLNFKHLLAFCAVPLTALLLVAIPFVTGMVPSETLPKIYDKFAHYFQSSPMRNYRNIYQHLKDVEESFPGGQWTNDFFEYARYNMYLVYLVGMMQTFFKSLYPVFVVPLIFGLNLRNKWNRQTFLFLTVLGAFFLTDYFFLVSNNFLSARYLLVLVVLSLVLVGFGMDRMITHLYDFRYRRIAFSVAIILCFLMPLGESLLKGADEKMEVKDAGLWLRDNRDLSKKRMIVTDERIAYYAGLMRGDYDAFQGEREKQFEQEALSAGCDIIVIYARTGEVEYLADFKQFVLVEKFSGDKNVALVYERKT